MGAGILVGALAFALFVWGIERARHVIQQNLANDCFPKEDEEAERALAEDAENKQWPPSYTSLADLHKRDQRKKRRVRFASKNEEYPPAPSTTHDVPSSWRSTFYEPARQRFETTIVDGYYVRHSFSSNEHSIAKF